MARELGIPLLVDAAQTGGSWPIDLQTDNVDLLAFSGHKGMLGPAGTGGLAIHDQFDVSRLPPLICGGTGSRSEDEVQPEHLPDRFEAGTANMAGIAGLEAGVRFVLKRGLPEIRRHEEVLCRRLIGGLMKIPGVTVYGTLDGSRQTAVVSFNISGKSSSQVAHALDQTHGILCRPGLHCAPRAHRTMGTFPGGAVRLAPGPFNTEADVDRAIDAIALLSGGKGNG